MGSRGVGRAPRQKIHRPPLWPVVGVHRNSYMRPNRPLYFRQKCIGNAAPEAIFFQMGRPAMMEINLVRA